MTKIIYLIIAILFIIFGIILGVFNPHKVDISLIYLQTQTPLSIIISLSVLFGILITVIFLGSIIFKLSWQLKRQIKENIKQANKNIELNSKLIEAKSLSTIESEK